MITLLLVSAAVLAACYFTNRHSAHHRVRDIAAMLTTGTGGVAGLAASSLLSGPPRFGVFAFVFIFGLLLERGYIRRRQRLLQLVAVRDVGVQMIALLRDMKGSS